MPAAFGYSPARGLADGRVCGPEGQGGPATAGADGGPFSDLSGFFATPFRIGAVDVPNRVVLAPMAGLTSSAYRRHLKAHGAGLVTTEMVSAYGLLHHNVRTAEYLEFAEEERPLAVQLFGDTPEAMAGAAALVLSRASVPDVIDINMGCPVRKVVRTGAGSALLADPDRAVALTAAVVKEATQAGVPVTVKLRSGIRAADVAADCGRTVIELARRLEAAGAAAVGMHPRTADQFYHGKADHAVTAALVAALSVPVIASGDIHSFSSAAAVVERTGVTAVMLARGAAGDPWSVDALLGGGDQVRPPLDEVVADLRRLLARAAEERGPVRAARWARKLLGWYLRPSGVSAAVVESLRSLSDVAALDTALRALVDNLQETNL